MNCVFAHLFCFSGQIMRSWSRKSKGNNTIWKIKNQLLNERIKKLGFENEWNQIKKTFHKVFNKAKAKNKASEKIYGHKLSTYYKYGVNVFVNQWCYFYINDGNKDSWTRCIPGCPMHYYSPTAKQYLLLTGVFKQISEFDACAPKLHFICRVCCSAHVSPQYCHVQDMEPNGDAIIAQHFLNKYIPRREATHKFALPSHIFRSVFALYLECICICICIVLALCL